ncbi:type VI secretion system-associated protein TagF [Prosthecomicrobium sp. N25]|uniref:type VI secretion system-associated protein TagF n=1 Tax=Prosthecomicrobium sp. N25 TaxID=3129254 RepID=UPI0030788216
MRCGLYGKLPCKRDFIAQSLPAGFLPVYEPWLQAGMAASKTALGSAWQGVYMKAPIWRFWLGASYCGRTVLGALMPSIDGIGRYFPLTIAASPEEDTFLPPVVAPQTEWFVKAEDLLLEALDETTEFDPYLAKLEALPGPPVAPRPETPDAVVVSRTGFLTGTGDETNLSSLFDAVRRSEEAARFENGTFWWTIGGEEQPAQILYGRRLPPPEAFAGLLAARIDVNLL